MDYMEAERHERCPVCPKEQTHVHEVLGSVWIAEARRTLTIIDLQL